MPTTHIAEKQLELFSSFNTIQDCPDDLEQSFEPDHVYHFGAVNLAASPYLHLIRAKGDPERSPRGPGRALLWRNLDTRTPEAWAERIAAHLNDGVPRTFNRIMVELSDFTADVAFGTTADEGLWLAVERGHLALTHEAPVLFTSPNCIEVDV